MRLLDDSPIARIEQGVDLLRFVRDLRRSGTDADWSELLGSFEGRFASSADPALAERVRDVITDRALVSSVRASGECEPLHLSYSQISGYEECPYAYKLGYVLRIPGRPKPYFSFGNSVHLSLNRFYEQVKEGKTPSLEELKAVYDENWQREGYVLKAQEDAYRNDGASALEAVYRRQLAAPVVPLHLEWRFTLPIGGHFVVGFVDRIDPTGDGRCRVIDYKTGKPKNQKDVDSDLQLTLYALAVKECLGLVPESLCLHFLSSDEILSTTRSDEQLEMVKDQVLSVADAITARRFSPNPNDFRCARCDYAGLCPALES